MTGFVPFGVSGPPAGLVVLVDGALEVDADDEEVEAAIAAVD